MKKILKENKYFILVMIISFLMIYIELPFYIEKTGGIINISNRLEENTTGSLNMAYVSSIKATPLTFIAAKLNSDWDLISNSNEIGNSTKKEALFRDKLLLDESYKLALINAYNLAHKPLKIKKQQIYVTYIYDEAITNLKIKDEIIKIDNKKIESLYDINKYINTLEEGTIIKIEVQNNGKIENRTAKIIKKDDRLYIGIMCNTKYDLETDIKLKFNKDEVGSSGGMILTLALYSKIMDIDLTNNKIIAGTGTIDINGKIGEISGIKYKLKGAVNEKADIFLVPSGNNYKEAIKEKNKNKYNIKIYSIDTINDAINILTNNKS